MSGGTDSKHYSHLTNTILRFCPYALGNDDVHRVHGTNERISVEDFGRLLCTYRAGLQLAAVARQGEARDVGAQAVVASMPDVAAGMHSSHHSSTFRRLRQ